MLVLRLVQVKMMEVAGREGKSQVGLMILLEQLEPHVLSISL